MKTSSRLMRSNLVRFLPLLIFSATIAHCLPLFAVSEFMGNSVDPKSGLRLEFSSEGIAKNGYRPLDVTIKRNTVVSDQSLIVTVRARNNNGGMQSPIINIAFDIPQGSAQLTQRVLLPQNSSWNDLRFSVSEDGKEIRRLNSYFGTSTGRNDERHTEAFPGWWFIDGDFDVVRTANDVSRQNSQLLPNTRSLLAFMPHFENEYNLLVNRDFQTFDYEILDDLTKMSTVNMTGLSGLPKTEFQRISQDSRMNPVVPIQSDLLC